MSKKICKKCDTKKPVEEFGKDSKQPDGVGTWCKQCAKEYRDSRKNVSTGTKTERINTKKPNKSNTPKFKPKKDIDINKMLGALMPTLIKNRKKKKIETDFDDSFDASKSKQTCKVDYLVSIQNHEIKGSFQIRSSYKPDKLMKSTRSVVTRQLQMLGIPDCEIIEIFKPEIIK